MYVGDFDGVSNLLVEHPDFLPPSSFYMFN
jgi:hypothetical protein